MVPFGHVKGESSGVLSERMNAGESKGTSHLRPPNPRNQQEADGIGVSGRSSGTNRLQPARQAVLSGTC